MLTPHDELLSPHFRLSEFTLSQVATRRVIRNEPSEEQLTNLRRLAHVLEGVREALRVPLVISSGFRSRALNSAIGGSPGSAHLYGRAADFMALGSLSPAAVVQLIVDAGIVFDQLIDEKSWVHLGLAPVGEAPRRQVLTALFWPGKPTRYVPGLLRACRL